MIKESERRELYQLVADLNGLVHNIGAELRYDGNTGSVVLIPEDCAVVPAEYIGEEELVVEDADLVRVPLHIKPWNLAGDNNYKVCRVGADAVKRHEGRSRR